MKLLRLQGGKSRKRQSTAKVSQRRQKRQRLSTSPTHEQIEELHNMASFTDDRPVVDPTREQEEELYRLSCGRELSRERTPPPFQWGRGGERRRQQQDVDELEEAVEERLFSSDDDDDEDPNPVTCYYTVKGRKEKSSKTRNTRMQTTKVQLHNLEESIRPDTLMERIIGALMSDVLKQEAKPPLYIGKSFEPLMHIPSHLRCANQQPAIEALLRARASSAPEHTGGHCGGVCQDCAVEPGPPPHRRLPRHQGLRLLGTGENRLWSLKATNTTSHVGETEGKAAATTTQVAKA
jgi:hypothetical protein